MEQSACPTCSSAQKKEFKTIEVKDFEQKEVSVMVTGRSRQGKSTALNNIFGLTLEAGLSATSVTKNLSVTKIKQNGVVVNAIDMPGLAALDVKKEEVFADMKNLKIGHDFTLLYCLSVAPNNNLGDTDQAIIKNIHYMFGKWVWNRCILVLTWCDDVKRVHFSEDEKIGAYIAFLREHAEVFYGIIKSCGAEVSGVKLLFDYTREMFKNQTKSDKLVAIPAAQKIFCNDVNIIPGMLFDKSLNWTDYAFIEILKKADELESDILMCFKYNVVSTVKHAATGGLTTAVVGGGIGAAIGAAAAAKTGTLVALPVGAVIGGAAAVPVACTVLAVGITSSVAFMIVQALKKRSKKD